MEKGAKIEKEKKKKWAERRDAADGKKEHTSKVYVMNSKEKKKKDKVEGENCEAEVSENDSSNSLDNEDNFITTKYIPSYFANSPFVGSRTILTKNAEISSLTRRDTVGTVQDYLISHTLPVKMFLAPEDMDTT